MGCQSIRIVFFFFVFLLFVLLVLSSLLIFVVVVVIVVDLVMMLSLWRCVAMFYEVLGCTTSRILQYNKLTHCHTFLYFGGHNICRYSNIFDIIPYGMTLTVSVGNLPVRKCCWVVYFWLKSLPILSIYHLQVHVYTVMCICYLFCNRDPHRTVHTARAYLVPDWFVMQPRRSRSPFLFRNEHVFT